ncbi:MAG: FISUMP domain-containing protein [Bacteroidota bacterium]
MVYKDSTTSVIVKNKKKTMDLLRYLTDSCDGKRYKIVDIGGQIWMTENLAYKTNSGCWAYDHDQTNVTKYGYLYNWKTAKTVCPQGWHLPDKDEFWALLRYFGSAYVELLRDGESGFSTLFGGGRYYVGGDSEIGEKAYFWSSSLEL